MQSKRERENYKPNFIYIPLASDIPDLLRHEVHNIVEELQILSNIFPGILQLVSTWGGCSSK